MPRPSRAERRELDRLRREATELVSTCTAARGAGDWQRAHRHCLDGLEIARRLVRLDPDDHRHATVRGGFSYNRAPAVERMSDEEFEQVRGSSDAGLGRLQAAAACARGAEHPYLKVDPSAGDSRRVASAPARSGWRLPRRVIAERIAHTADARARYVRLLAAFRGAEAADEVRVLGVAALNTYGELVLDRRSGCTEADLHRIADQVLPAFERVGLMHD